MNNCKAVSQANFLPVDGYEYEILKSMNLFLKQKFYETIQNFTTDYHFNKNVVRGFRVLAVLSTKERNTLTPNLLDQLMQLIS